MYLALLLETDFRACGWMQNVIFLKYLLILRFVVFTFDCFIVLFEKFPRLSIGLLNPFAQSQLLQTRITLLNISNR